MLSLLCRLRTRRRWPSPRETDGGRVRDTTLRAAVRVRLRTCTVAAVQLGASIHTVVAVQSTLAQVVFLAHAIEWGRSGSL